MEMNGEIRLFSWVALVKEMQTQFPTGVIQDVE